MKKRHGWMRMIAALLCLAMGMGMTGVAAAGSVNDIEMKLPMEISFKFSKSMYTITIVVENGVVTPAGTNGVLTVAAGSNAVFSFTPNTGYRLQTVREDGVVTWTRTATSGEPPTGTHFAYITEDHVLEVVFSRIPATATASPTPTASPTNPLATTAPTTRPGGGGGGSGASGVRATPSPTPVTTVSLPDGLSLIHI